MRAACCPHRLKLTGFEGVLDLLIQIVAVGDNYDPWVGNLAVQRKRLAQHYHRQGFT